VESTIAEHRAFYATDEFVEIRLMPDGPRRRTWRELEQERARQVSAKRHAGSAAFENVQLLDWHGGFPEFFTSLRAASLVERSYELIEDIESRAGPTCCR
jgi:hypothetical protein